MTRRSSVPLASLALTGALLASASTARAEDKSPSSRPHFKVAVPDRENMQYLAFWAAKTAGSFEHEGLDLEVLYPPQLLKGPSPVDPVLAKDQVDAAVVPPAVYLRLIAAKAKVLVAANLFTNDGYAMVVRREVAEARKLSSDGPVADRVKALDGMSIAYPPAGYGRFKALLATQKLDDTKNVRSHVILPRDERTPFKDASVDAAYLQSPFLEQVVASDEGIVVVNQARGEPPEMASAQTNVLVVTQKAWTERHDVVVAAVRAIADGERRVHETQDEVVTALAKEFPTRRRAELAAAVRLYEPAIPKRATARAEDLLPAMALIPESVPRPDVTGIDLATFVTPDLAPPPPALGKRWIAIVAGLLALVVAAFFVMRRRAMKTAPKSDDPTST